MFLLVLWSITIILCIYLYFQEISSRFSEYGVKYLAPIPLFGNMTKPVLTLEHIVESIDKLYKKFPGERFLGRFNFVQPVVIINDLELIKRITIKDFEYFLDHRQFVDEHVDPLFGRNLFTLTGQEWKDMRSTLSPAFTSSKMRAMVPFMVETGDLMMKSLLKKIKESGNDYLDVEMKNVTTRYTNDVIASCAFGLKIDSHTEEKNDFYEMAKVSATFKFRQFLLFFAYAAFPSLIKKLKISMFPDKCKNFFINLFTDTVKNREENKIIRADMIHLLMEAKKGNLTHDKNNVQDENAGFATVEESSFGKSKVNRKWSDMDLIAQAVIFFIAGFDGVASAMAFLTHELAVNPDVQEKLYEEIMETDAKNGGKFDYDSIQKMTYLDMVVSESLRVWPQAGMLDRLCTKDYNLGKPNDKCEKDFIIHKGECISIPVWSIHKDPQYFENPEKFDPERFSEENKQKINPYSYIPFGVGPRNCIGSRFALCEVKVMAYQLLKHVELSPAAKTMRHPKLATDTFNMRLKDDHWCRLKLRH